MSKLQSYNSERIYWAVEQVEQEAGDIASLHLDDNLFYIKSEADKVIAEKDREIAELKEQVSEERSAKVAYKISANDMRDGLEKAYAEIKYHKYKRCLDKAKWCKAEADAAFLRYNWDSGRYDEVDFYEKWHKRWLKLAKKFKETK